MSFTEVFLLLVLGVVVWTIHLINKYFTKNQEPVANLKLDELQKELSQIKSKLAEVSVKVGFKDYL